MRVINIAAVLAIIAVSLSGASAWSTKGLSCPNVTTVDINWPDYLGVWYEIGPFDIHTWIFSCSYRRLFSVEC
jgi:lipocalin